MCSSRFLETPLLSSIIDLLHTLWATNLGGRGAEAGSPPPGQPGTQESPKLPALHLVSEFLYVLLALAKHLRYGRPSPPRSPLRRRAPGSLRRAGDARKPLSSLSLSHVSPRAPRGPVN